MKKLILFVLLSCAIQVHAQDSSHLRVSLLTCAPGDELYSLFGHTAIRVVDSATGLDYVYNYGTFDFNDPDFYMKFTRGKLDYMLSVSTLPEFMQEYQFEKRTVTEQELELSGTEKLYLLQTLNKTLTGPGRYYKYDFLYDNCTTRVRDLLLRAGLRAERQLVPDNTRFRDLLHQYLDGGAQPWSKFGIDLLLGSPVDKKMNITESMFLPDYLMKGVDSSVHGSNNVLQNRIVLNEGLPSNRKNTNWPLYVFSTLAIVVIAVSYSKNKTAVRLVGMMDMLLFLVTGLIGCLLLFMWFGTDHRSCAYNYNLLWALPTHVVAAFALRKQPRWLAGYLLFCVALYLLLLIGWFFLPQHLNIALFPFLLLLLQRCWMRRKPVRR